MNRNPSYGVLRILNQSVGQILMARNTSQYSYYAKYKTIQPIPNENQSVGLISVSQKQKNSKTHPTHLNSANDRGSIRETAVCPKQGEVTHV